MRSFEVLLIINPRLPKGKLLLRRQPAKVKETYGDHICRSSYDSKVGNKGNNLHCCYIK